MSPKVRAMLDQIDTLLNETNNDARDLWSVLTALRGPDAEIYEDKAKYTIPIRRVAFPKTANNLRSAAYIADFSTSAPAEKAVMGDYTKFHFTHHILAAQRALGMFP